METTTSFDLHKLPLISSSRMESADPEERSSVEGHPSICSRVFHWGVPSNETLLVSDDSLKSCPVSPA